MKGLLEKRAEKEKRLKEILEKAKAEVRAMSEEENQEFDKLEKEIENIDSTIEAEKRVREKTNTQTEGGQKTEKEQTTEKRAEAEKEEFTSFLRGEITEKRADTNLTFSGNTAVVPISIAKEIIKKVHDICPVYQMAKRYNVKGTLNIPYYEDGESGGIQMAYASEFTGLSSSNGTFGSIELNGFLAGVLSKVSKSLINNSDFDILSFVIEEMAQSISRWIEKELLNGTADKITGLSTIKQIVPAKSTQVLTADDLIDLQETIPDTLQNKCIWIMNKTTRTAIRKLKDGDGNYILNKDATARWGYTLFGKEVYTSENMPEMEAGEKAVIYGDMEGLAVKVSEEFSIEVLREKYSTEHAVGVVGWLEMDAKIRDQQMLAALQMGAA